MPLPKALRLAAADLDGRPLQRAALALADAADAGTPIEQAYADPRLPFAPLHRALVSAGVRAGDLPAALDEIAVHATAQAEAGRRIRAALTHPVVTATCALAIGVAA